MPGSSFVEEGGVRGGGGGVWQAGRPLGAARPPNKSAGPGPLAPALRFQGASRPAAAPLEPPGAQEGRGGRKKTMERGERLGPINPGCAPLQLGQ